MDQHLDSGAVGVYYVGYRTRSLQNGGRSGGGRSDFQLAERGERTQTQGGEELVERKRYLWRDRAT